MQYSKYWATDKKLEDFKSKPTHRRGNIKIYTKPLRDENFSNLVSRGSLTTRGYKSAGRRYKYHSKSSKRSEGSSNKCLSRKSSIRCSNKSRSPTGSMASSARFSALHFQDQDRKIKGILKMPKTTSSKSPFRPASTMISSKNSKNRDLLQRGSPKDLKYVSSRVSSPRTKTPSY